ncbi:MAG: DegT/DnrJ/EryC1/StrS family aminotransferase [Phycisphaerales bacterium]|nr:DegT/DnrJ/EryC1/StrS family aminotransferase [Phycisphaerales bacterium]
MTHELAAYGGTKVREWPLDTREYSQARFGEEEKQAVMDVLDSGHLCRVFGKRTTEFEHQVAEYFGVAAAAAVSSGTAAIHCALAALEVGPGDEVITSPITDMGSVIPIIARNAVPIFADVDTNTFNITADSIERVLTAHTKAVIVVHLAGQCCVMQPIIDLARERSIHVIEDCAQSYLSTCDGRTAGTIGDVGCFSLNDFKHITCGDGGFLISDDRDLIRRAALFADKGYPRSGPVRNSLVLGMNYRMTELQAAVAGVQLKKLASIIERRRTLGRTLNRLLSQIGGIIPPAVAKGIEHSYWFYPIIVDSQLVGLDASTFARDVTAEGIPVAFPYLGSPVYLFDSVRRLRICDSEIVYKQGLCPNAEESLRSMMVLPCNEFMTEDDVRDITAALVKVVNYHVEKKQRNP